MRRLSWLCGVLLLCCFVSGAHSYVEFIKISSDRRRAFDVRTFGFQPHGKIHLKVTNLELDVPSEDDDISFVLHRTDRYDQYQSQKSPYKRVCRTYGSRDVVIPVPISSRKSFEYIQYVVEEGFYHLTFCNRGKSGRVSMEMWLIEYNQAADGSYQSYLPAGLKSLPTAFMCISFAFLILFALWVWVCHRQAEFVSRLHYLMGLLVSLKVCSTFVDGFRYHKLGADGQDAGWSTFYYVLHSVRVLMFLTVLALLLVGWSLLHTYLKRRERWLLAVVLLLNAGILLYAPLLELTSPVDAGYRWRMYMVERVRVVSNVLLGCIYVVSSCLLRRGTAFQRTLDKLGFRMAVYMAMHPIIHAFIAPHTSVRWSWLPIVLEQVATWCFFLTVGMLFVPSRAFRYVRVPDGSDSNVISSEDLQHTASDVEMDAMMGGELPPINPSEDEKLTSMVYM